MTLLETVRERSAGGEVDVLRESVRLLAQAIMEDEVTEITGVAKGERDPEHRRPTATATGDAAGTRGSG